jgi:tetratricopeptide (TPR) repeat protein
LYELGAAVDPLAPPYVASAGVATVLTGAVLIAVRRVPGVAVAWACYAAILLPVLGGAQVGPQIAADRYTYLACLPWAVLFAGGVRRLAAGRGARVAVGAVAAYLAVLGLLSGAQARVWRDAIALWTHAVAVDPGSPTAAYNLGEARQSRGDLAGARAAYDEALRLNPGFPGPYNNRGLVRALQGDLAGAITDYDEALRLAPDFASAYGNRGTVRAQQGDLDGAIADFKEALRLAPDLAADLYNNLGQVRAANGDFAGALASLDEAIRIDPTRPEPYANRGWVHDMRGDRDAAVADYRRALELAPREWPARRAIEDRLAAVRAGLPAAEPY